MILDTITATKSVTHAEVMRLDSLSPRDCRCHFHHRCVHDQLRTQSPTITTIIMRRIYLAMLVRKAQCVLHYRYLIAGRSYSSYVYSRQSCIDAAIDILQYQSIAARGDQTRRPTPRGSSGKSRPSSKQNSCSQRLYFVSILTMKSRLVFCPQASKSRGR